MTKKIRKIIRAALASVSQTSMALIGIMIFSKKLKEKYQAEAIDYVFLVITIFTLTMSLVTLKL